MEVPTSVCVVATCVLCRRAFLAPRALIPRQCLLSERLQLPAWSGKLFWAALILLAFGAVFDRLFFGLLALVSAALLFLDCFIWSPHLLHFSVASLSLYLERPCLLDVFFVCLYVYGGAQKINASFANGFVENFLGGFLRRQGFYPERDDDDDNTASKLNIPSIPVLGYLAALSETAFGIGILFLPGQRVLYGYGVGLHAAILFFLCVQETGFHGIIGWNVFCLMWSGLRFLNLDDKVSSNLSCQVDLLLVLELLLF